MEPHESQATSPAPADAAPYGEAVTWRPQKPRFRLVRVLVILLIAAAAVLFTAAILPGVSVGTFGDALLTAVLLALLNALLPPIVAALRLPFTLALGFVLILLLDALILKLAGRIDANSIH